MWQDQWQQTQSKDHSNDQVYEPAGVKPGQARSRLGRPLRVLSTVLSKRVYRRMVFVICVVYLLVYLSALQNITFSGFGGGAYGASAGAFGGGFSLVTAHWSAMFRRTGFLVFDSIAVIGTPLFTLHLSPMNILIGVLMSVLVGMNLTLTWIAWRQPKACSVNRASGLLGILPGLLAGSACCAPTIIIILGIQATATMITASQWMIPVAFVLLLGSLVWITHKTRPDLL